jgi:hypothetical protein
MKHPGGGEQDGWAADQRADGAKDRKYSGSGHLRKRRIGGMGYFLPAGRQIAYPNPVNLPMPGGPVGGYSGLGVG